MESNGKGNLKLGDPGDSCTNANDLLCYSWKDISQYPSDTTSQSTQYSLLGKYVQNVCTEYMYRTHNKYLTGLVKT